MLKFLKRIRQKLIVEGKLKKYALYAFGEIVLLVIGILIALQINNWNSDRLNEKKEKLYLKNIQRDLKVQLQDINKQFDYESLQMKNAYELIMNSENIFSANLADSVLEKLSILVSRLSFVPVDPTFQDLKSTGNLILINNYKLRDEIIQYYQRLNVIATVIGQNNNGFVDQVFVQNMISNSMVNMMHLSEFTKRFNADVLDVPASMKQRFDKHVHKNLKEPKNQILLVNLLSSRYLISSLHKSWMEELITKTENLYKSLEDEIN